MSRRLLILFIVTVTFAVLLVLFAFGLRAQGQATLCITEGGTDGLRSHRKGNRQRGTY